MVNQNKPTRIQKSRASKNSLYMTTFILLVALIFGLPTGAYIYMAKTHKPNQTTSNDTQVQQIQKDKLPKPKEASDDQSETKRTKETSSSSSDDTYGTYDSSSSQSKKYMSDYTTNSSSTSDATATGTYTVKQGDNLYRIAVNHGMTQQELMDLNGLTEPAVSVGQVLKVK